MSAVNIPDYIHRPSRPLRGQHDQSFINIQSATEQYRSSFFPNSKNYRLLEPASQLTGSDRNTHIFSI